MRKLLILVLILTTVLTACADNNVNSNEKSNNQKVSVEQEKSGDTEEESPDGQEVYANSGKGKGDNNESTKESSVVESNSSGGNKFNIHFVYNNSFYGYDLEATWSNISIKRTNTNEYSKANGLELLFDRSLELFNEIDTDKSGSLTNTEWIAAGIEEDFSYNKQILNNKGEIDYEGFTNFAQMIGGVEAYPDKFKITQPTLDGYAIEYDEDDYNPLGIKILRASAGGFNGAYGISYPEGTVFIELDVDYRIFLEEMPDTDVTIAFDYPLMHMYVEDTKEVKDTYSHGALGFNSVVNAEEFNSIFHGKTFSLRYDAYFEGKVVGVYDLTIIPKK